MLRWKPPPVSSATPNSENRCCSPPVAPLAQDEDGKTEGFNTWWDEEADGLKSGNTEASGGKRKREADAVVHLQTLRTHGVERYSLNADTGPRSLQLKS